MMSVIGHIYSALLLFDVARLIENSQGCNGSGSQTFLQRASPAPPPWRRLLGLWFHLSRNSKTGNSYKFSERLDSICPRPSGKVGIIGLGKHEYLVEGARKRVK